MRRSAGIRARHARAPRVWHRVLVALGLTLAMTFVGVGAAAALLYRRLDGNITQKSIDEALGTDRPTNAPAVEEKHEPVDILVMGSDTRAGDNGFVGGDEVDERSDTTILLHLSGDRQSAYGISIPRDSMVEIPDCERTDGKGRTYRSDGSLHMFNEAFTIGGAACTVKTVEHMTDVRIEDYVVVDFKGFTSMVDALGGVRVCIPEAINDRTGNISFAAGPHNLKGEKALDYVRLRYGIGDGTDTQRTVRQQLFIAAMIRKATSKGILARPDKIYSFLDAATKSLTTDMSISSLAKLGREVQNIGLGNIAFTTVPTQEWPVDRNRLIWTSAADGIWEAVRTDQPLPGQKVKRTSTPSPTPTPSTAPTPRVQTAPKDVKVKVLSGTGSLADAETAAEALRARGFQVESVELGEQTGVTASVVRYDPRWDESGRTLATSVIGATSEQVEGLWGTLELVVGSDWKGVRAVRVGATGSGKPSPSATPLELRTALSDTCA
ncbi:LCP family protein [Motilibacter aurantiacus]|uniref:LCP family protein n=1 Tax=Motilibacter aurantiacus TaxID=2714955 RepID=UPI001409F598|nr:LCP family protein [Motilibacter aurantiacus]NHC43828.1 LCP family protein [Motilibacter aurantiacus]